MSMFKWFQRKIKSQTKRTDDRPPEQVLEELKGEEISARMEETVSRIQSLLGENDDFVLRRFHVFGKYSAVLMYFTNFVDEKAINTDILKALMYIPRQLQEKQIDKSNLMDILLNETLVYSKTKLESHLKNIVEGLMGGQTVVVVEGLDQVFLLNTRQVEKRSVDQPGTEQVIRGPREGFIEMLGTNISLLRYRLQTPNFRVKMMTLGRMTKSKVAVCYIEGVVNPALVQEVWDRLSVIDIDAVLDSGYLEQFIEDHHLSPFPQIQNTERPDKAVAEMIEGRVTILVDGSPFALIVPTVFHQFYQTSEDYAERFLMSSAIRLIRLIALFFSLISSSLYVAIISYNPELIPTEFAVAVAGGRAGVPFPAVIEVFLMEVSMEILREATVRLPQQVGGALSIVGVLVIGQAAVSAGFVSPITVVVIALTTIGSFATPAYNAALALRLLRFPIIFLAGTFGLYGVMVGIILVINHMLSLRSFGVPYMSPIVPGNFQGMKDVLIRGPLWWMSRRPALLHTPNDDRLAKDTIEAIKQPPSNTLDPIKVGNERGVISDGDAAGDHRASDSDHTD